MQTDPHHSILGGYVLGVPALLLLLLLSLFPCLSVLANIVAMDRVLIHFPLLRSSSPSHFSLLFLSFFSLALRFLV